MILNAEGASAHAERLHRAGRRCREDPDAGRRLQHLRAVPLQAGVGGRHALEESALPARLGQLHVEDADLGLGRRPDLAAEGLREKLVPEAETEEGHLPLEDRLADGGALGLEPRMEVVLPDVHRAAHDPEGVVAAEFGNRLPGIELDRAPLDAVLAQKVPEHARVFDRNVLEDEELRVGR